MARFILETDPFLSTGMLVSKEVLEWNHFSESCSGNGRSLRSFTTCMGVICSRGSRKTEKSSARGKLLAASPTFIILQHVGFSWGHAIPDLLETNLWGLVSAKPQAAWSEGYHLCVILVASGLQFTCEVLGFLLLLQKWFCSPSRQLSRPDLISQDAAVMEGGQYSVISV